MYFWKVRLSSLMPWQALACFFFYRFYFALYFGLCSSVTFQCNSSKRKTLWRKKLQGNILKKHFPWSVLNVSTFSIYLIVFVCLFLLFYSRKQKITLILFLTMFSLMPCVDLVPKSCVAILSYCFCFALVNLWTSNKWLFLGLQQTL